MSKTPLSVLVTDASQKNSLAIVRALGEQGIAVYVLGHHWTDIARVSRFCADSLIINKYDCDLVLEYIENAGIDIVIPVGTTGIKFFVENKSFFENAVKFLLPSSQQVADMMSKKRTMQIAEHLGVPIPRTFFPRNFDEANEYASIIGFPCVMKWLYEVGDNVVDYAHNLEDFKRKYQSMCLRRGFDEQSGLPMVQEYIKGVGVGYFGLFFDGRPVAHYQHERLREAPPSGGVSACAQTIYDSDLKKYGELLLTALQWNGVAMVEFKKLPDGRLVLMEVNPKFWGSLELGIFSGINFPLQIIRLLAADGGSYIDEDEQYLCGRKFHWPLSGDCKYMFTSWKRFTEVSLDLVNPNVGSDLRLFSDPKPTLFHLILSFALRFRNLLRRYSN